MSNQCESCSTPTDLFLCTRCGNQLQCMLADLIRGPITHIDGDRTRHSLGLLDNLEDVALKRTRMGNGTGHRKRGDEMPAPFEPDIDRCDKDGRPISTPQGRADLLLTQARNTLSTIIRDLCEHRGVEIRDAFQVTNVYGPLLPGWARAPEDWQPTTVEMARWLNRKTWTIVADESAGQWFADIDSLVRRIEHVIDRPVKVELLGFCITQTDAYRTCNTALRAREDEIEVRCRKCHTTRRCDTVRAQGQSDAKRALITWDKVLETNKTQPDGWRVNDRTLRNWRATGALRPREYLRPDGTHGGIRRTTDDVELFKWNDIEQLRTNGVARGVRKRTRSGAAAR